MLFNVIFDYFHIPMKGMPLIHQTTALLQSLNLPPKLFLRNVILYIHFSLRIPNFAELQCL